MAGIFISYRRGDTAPYAARLRERLGAQFGTEYVFMDVDSLRPGEPFPRAIESSIAASVAVLALIGAEWLTIADGSGRRRLENPADLVRIELGIWEDPAIGSAAGPLVSRLVAQGVVSDGATVVVEQGHAIGRPSRIRVQVSGERVRIGGAGIAVAEGTLTF